MRSTFERLLLLPSALLAVSLQLALASPLEARDSDNNTSLPAPIAVPPSRDWDGIDGSWSSFTVGLGTPLQYIRAFVSFASYQTLAVLPKGCQGAADVGACAATRGSLFNESASTTFEQIGIYAWMIEQNLGIEGNSDYGYDVQKLGGNGEDGPTLQNTTIGGFAVSDFYLGVLGVNPKPTNFTENTGSPSLMTQLKEQKLISSVSASYTAGAPYRFDKVLGSLTLGGQDTSKYIPNDLEFTFAADNSRDIVVAVQSISTAAANSSSPVPTELLTGAIYAYIDSTVPQIWLPEESCRVFEYEFGLVYDNATELYLVNDTLHDSLVQRNASITFSLAQSTTGGDTVQITLPYAAFDLTASPPYQGVLNETRYFPLRRAANETQYTLGRTFLQEAYLTVNWESQRFNVSQVAWTQDADENLVAIAPGAESLSSTYPGASGSLTTSHKSSGLGAGAIAGIAVGIVALLVLCGLFLAWYIRRKRRAARARAAEAEKLGDDDNTTLRSSGIRSSGIPSSGAARGQEANVFPKAELEGSAPIPPESENADNKRLLSAHGSVDPDTPGTLNAPSSLGGGAGYFPNRGSSAYSPSTPTAGEGTYDSTHSSSHGTGTHSSILSPLSPSSASEADSRERQVFEMAGDMPTIKEKDGKALTEKEAIQHRERIYNGVETPPQSSTAVDEQHPALREERERRRVSPEEVVPADVQVGTGSHLEEPRDFTRHRAFSFEDERPGRIPGTGTDSSDDLYS